MSDSGIKSISEPQIHEIRISEFFGGNVRFYRQEPVFDSPVALLLFANRSGSNLLAEHLLASGRFSSLQETLNFENVEDVAGRHGIGSFPEYLQAIAAHNIRGNIFGTKCSLDQLMMLLRWNILSMFSGAKIINIERHDIVSQAVSMSIALQTKSWSSDVSPTTRALYDFDEIKQYFNAFASDIVKRKMMIDVLEFEARTFEYEQVVSEPFTVVSECCKLFGVLPPDRLPAHTQLKKQGGDLNREFSARFRQEIRQGLLGRS